MRRNVWTLAAALVGAAGTTLPGRPATAQDPVASRPPRYAVEGYLAQYQLDDQLGTSTRSLGGFGLRVTLLPTQPDREATSILQRAVGSLFGTYTTRQGTPNVSTLHLGIQTDFSILPAPAGGLFDPFFGLSIGVFRTSREDIVTRRGRVNRSDLAVSPGVGLRVPFLSGIGARGDDRVPLVFGTSATANVVGEAGMYISF